MLAFLTFITNIRCQEIELKAIYTSSTTKEFKNNIGYGLGYNHFINRNRIGISFSQVFYNTPYDDIYSSTEDGVSIYIKQVEPDNQRIALKINYVFRLIDNPKSRLYFGPEIGLNYFIIREQYDRIANGNISGGHFASNYKKNNKLGVGLLFEFELKEIIHKRISTYLSVNPEITSFEKFGMSGGYEPYFIGWMNFNLGVRYLINAK